MSGEAERAYLRTVAELQQIASNAPYVTQDWILQVAGMDPDDMRRRLIRGFDWSGHFLHSLDGIPELQSMPGAGIDGCRSHKQVRAVVDGLLEKSKRDAARIASLEAELAAVRAQPVALPVLSYDAGQGISIEATKQRDGTTKWAIRRLGEVMARNGEWEWEPMPSSRDDEFLSRCRFDSAADAAALIVQPAKGAV